MLVIGRGVKAFTGLNLEGGSPMSFISFFSCSRYVAVAIAKLSVPPAPIMPPKHEGALDVSLPMGPRHFADRGVDRANRRRRLETHSGNLMFSSGAPEGAVEGL
jgi:hypothetical protein